MNSEDDAVSGGSQEDINMHDDMNFEDIINRMPAQFQKNLELPDINFNPQWPLTTSDSAALFGEASSMHHFQSPVQPQSENSGTSGASEEPSLSRSGSLPYSPRSGRSSQGPTPTQHSQESSSRHDAITTDLEEEATTPINGPGGPQYNHPASDDDLLLVEERSSPAIKKEATNNDTGVSARVSKYAGMDHIVLSDSGSDMEELGAPQQTTPHNGANPNLATGSNVNIGTRAFLRNANPKGRRTAAQLARMLEAQKHLAMQATRKTVTGGANSIFKGLESAAQSTARPFIGESVTANARSQTTDEDEHAWMLQDLSDSDSDAAAM